MSAPLVFEKRCSSEAHARVEALAGALYHLLGVHTVGATSLGDKVISLWNADLMRIRPAQFHDLDERQAIQIARIFHASVLTKNWDVVGAGFDNLMIHAASDDIYSIDHGGAFDFRARGERKQYGDDIDEHRSLRSRPGETSTYAFRTVFSMHPRAEHAGLKSVRQLSLAHAAEAFAESGLPNADDLQATFLRRRAALLNLYRQSGDH